jgi:hypothetical protein
LPTGCTPVPSDDEGKHKVGDWEFFYKGWMANEGEYFQSGATTEELFPDSQLGELDSVLLAKMGLTKKHIQEKDALFFNQLLLPMCDPTKSGVRGYQRLAFYSKVELFSNLYAFSIGLGRSYGDAFKLLKLCELVKFDGIVVCDGIQGGGALY